VHPIILKFQLSTGLVPSQNPFHFMTLPLKLNLYQLSVTSNITYEHSQNRDYPNTDIRRLRNRGNDVNIILH